MTREKQSEWQLAQEMLKVWKSARDWSPLNPDGLSGTRSQREIARMRLVLRFVREQLKQENVNG
jgi:hypothetical protein